MPDEANLASLFRIMIVDDEPLVRNEMCQNVDWEACGFKLVAACGNGREALERLDEAKPDVVLTDINMPFMDGLELARNLKEVQPRIHTVILTGYDQFEYAQQAVKLHVRDFILKPITKSELVPVLGRLAETLQKERNALENLQMLIRQVNESKSLLRERFFNRLIEGGLPERKLYQGIRQYNLPSLDAKMQVIAVSIDDPESLEARHTDTPTDVWQFAVYNICEEIMAGEFGGTVFQNWDGITLAIMTGDDSQRLEEVCTAACGKVQNLVSHYLSFTVSAGLGTVAEGYRDLPASAKGALKALDYRFVLGDEAIISIRDMEYPAEHNDTFLVDIRRKIKRELSLGVPGTVEQCISEMIQEIRCRRYTHDRAKTLIRHLLIDFTDIMEELTGDHQRKWVDFFRWNSELDRIRDLDRVESWFAELCRKGAEQLASRRCDLQHAIVDKARQYVSEHYHEENLSLQAVLKALAVSSSYFSSIFKRKMGETFIEYLTRYRIEKAMELMKTTTMKNYEVAERVGLPDPQYFSTLFKKITGMTPSEYRERINP